MNGAEQTWSWGTDRWGGSINRPDLQANKRTATKPHFRIMGPKEWL